MEKLVLRLFFEDGSTEDIELPAELEEEKAKSVARGIALTQGATKYQLLEVLTVKVDPPLV